MNRLENKVLIVPDYVVNNLEASAAQAKSRYGKAIHQGEFWKGNEFRRQAFKGEPPFHKLGGRSVYY